MSAATSAPADRPPAAGAFRALVMGSGPGAMGLADVRARAAEVRRTLDELAQVLAFRPEALTWHDALEKFGVASVQAASLRASLRPLADSYAAHPTSVDAASAATLPLLLSSRRAPDAEAAATASTAAAVAGAGGGGGGGGEGGEGGGGSLYVALGAAADAVNAVVDHLTTPATDGGAATAPTDGDDDGRGVLAPGSAARRALAAAAHAAAAPGAAPLPARPAGGDGAAKRAPVDPKAALVAAALAGRLP